jgi:hypothetical protein
LNGEANRARKRQNRATIAADVRRFAHVINTDGVLGTHNGYSTMLLHLLDQEEDEQLDDTYDRFSGVTRPD